MNCEIKEAREKQQKIQLRCAVEWDSCAVRCDVYGALRHGAVNIQRMRMRQLLRRLSVDSRASREPLCNERNRNEIEFASVSAICGRIRSALTS